MRGYVSLLIAIGVLICMVVLLATRPTPSIWR